MDTIAEAVVTAVAGEILLGENSEPLLEPLSDPWSEEEEKKQGEKKRKSQKKVNMSVIVP